MRGYSRERQGRGGVSAPGTKTRGAQVVYQYGYGYDGGRRWRKDLLNNVWTWYPCGVACTAGDLVEETSDLTGNVWTASASYLRAGGGCSSRIISRSGETHHFDLIGAAGVVTNSSGTIVSSHLYDAFSATRFTSGTAATPWRNGDHYQAEEGMIANCWIDADQDNYFAPQQCGPPKNEYQNQKMPKKRLAKL